MISGTIKLVGLYAPWAEWCRWAVAELARRGYSGTVTSGKRSAVEQSRLYQAYIARGRTGLPAAPPGRSAHEYGLAIDFEVDQGKGSPQQRAVIALMKSWGAEVVPNDPVHFQYPGYRQFRGG